MKSIKMMLATAFAMVCMTASAQEKTETFKVSGKCGMCEKRIEKAAKVNGVTKADWDQKTQMMAVTYDASKTSSAKIQQRIAEAGHDTEKYTAGEKAYSKLPDCCKYDREANAAKEEDHSGHKH